MPNLEEKWLDILEPFQVDQNLAHTLFEELVRAYSEPGRHYHTINHIEHVLQTVDALSHLLENKTAVQLAAWYHDVVYDARARDNEERSTELADQRLTAIKLPAGIVAETVRLILMTKQHTAPVDDRDAQVLLDADLAILGASPEEYRVYAQAIRHEYTWVEDTAYRQGRTRVLESFSRRPRLYATDELFAKLEQPAHRNIAAEIASLNS